jgi:hypothetical protein
LLHELDATVKLASNANTDQAQRVLSRQDSNEAKSQRNEPAFQRSTKLKKHTKVAKNISVIQS